MFLPFISNAKRKHPTFIFSAIRSRLCLRRRFHHGFLLHICWEKFIHEENAATWEKSAEKEERKKKKILFFFFFGSCWGAPYIQDFTVRTRNRAPRHIMNFEGKYYEFWLSNVGRSGHHTITSLGKILKVSKFYVKNICQVVRLWHHQLTHLNIHIDVSRKVLWKFSKLQSVLTSLFSNWFSSSFHCFVRKLLLFLLKLS